MPSSRPTLAIGPPQQESGCSAVFPHLQHLYRFPIGSLALDLSLLRSKHDARGPEGDSRLKRAECRLRRLRNRLSLTKIGNIYPAESIQLPILNDGVSDPIHHGVSEL